MILRADPNSPETPVKFSTRASGDVLYVPKAYMPWLEEHGIRTSDQLTLFLCTSSGGPGFEWDCDLDEVYRSCGITLESKETPPETLTTRPYPTLPPSAERWGVWLEYTGTNPEKVWGADHFERGGAPFTYRGKVGLAFPTQEAAEELCRDFSHKSYRTAQVLRIGPNNEPIKADGQPLYPDPNDVITRTVTIPPAVTEAMRNAFLAGCVTKIVAEIHEAENAAVVASKKGDDAAAKAQSKILKRLRQRLFDACDEWVKQGRKKT